MKIQESNQIHIVTSNGDSVLRITNSTPAMAGSYCCSIFEDHHKESCGILRVLYGIVIQYCGVYREYVLR